MVAYKLGIAVELISVKRSNNLTTPNNIITGASMTTQSCGYVRIQIISRQESYRNCLISIRFSMK